MAFPKFQTKEVLNKVLNAGEDALKIDIDNVTLDGSQLSVDIDNANDSIVIFSNTVADGSGTNTVPLVDAAGNLQIDIVSSALPSGGATAANQSTIIGHVDGLETLITSTNSKIDTLDAVQDNALTKLGEIETTNNANQVLLGTIDSDTDAIKTSLGNIDNSVDGNYLNVNMNLAGTDAQAGEGTISATTQRVTIATDDDGVAHLATIAGAVSTQMQVDVVAISAQSDGTYIGDIKFGEALPAGSAAIGKLAANSGVDIGDVDVTSLPASTNTIEIVGDAAENANAAGNPVLTGGRYDSSVRTLGNTDVGALALDPTGALYTREFLGQAGSILVTGTSNAVTTGVSGTKFVAIQFLEDTTFDAGATGLVASTTGLWPDDGNASTTIDGDGGAVTGSEVFPQGMTIFGRWDGFKLDSGKVIGYLGYV